MRRRYPNGTMVVRHPGAKVAAEIFPVKNMTMTEYAPSTAGNPFSELLVICGGASVVVPVMPTDSAKEVAARVMAYINAQPVKP